MASSGGCPVEEILGAVLGTFFGTLLFCVVLALLLVFVYRRHQQRAMTAQRIAGKYSPMINRVLLVILYFYSLTSL